MFQKLYRGSIINILLDTFAKEFALVKSDSINDIKKIDNDFKIPDVIKIRLLEYLTDTHYIFSWFIENY